MRGDLQDGQRPGASKVFRQSRQRLGMLKFYRSPKFKSRQGNSAITAFAAFAGDGSCQIGRPTTI